MHQPLARLAAAALALCALAAPLVAPVAAAELSTRGQLLDRVAAVVNEGVVTSTELDDQVTLDHRAPA